MKKILHFVFTLIVFSTTIHAQYISELHYDNDGSDVGEAVEIFVPAGTDITGWTIALYNGSSTQLNVYATLDIIFDCPATAPACAGAGTGLAGCTVVIAGPSNGIQNGAPDGLALVDAGGTVVQFLSYEGSFTAASGPASGMTSMDIGTAETGSTPIGNSIQISPDGVGTAPAVSDFDDCPVSALPIVLGDFDVNLERDKSVAINWTTIQESNSDYFDLEWSTDAKVYKTIYTVSAQGESNTLSKYSYNHSDVSEGLNYYRLKQVDKNGELSRSNIKAVQIRSSSDLGFSPTRVIDNIQLSGDVSSVEIFNTSGKIVRTFETQSMRFLDVSSLRGGMYIIRLNGIDSAITKKMFKL